jgi:hypothetical protein
MSPGAGADVTAPNLALHWYADVATSLNKMDYEGGGMNIELLRLLQQLIDRDSFQVCFPDEEATIEHDKLIVDWIGKLL